LSIFVPFVNFCSFLAH